MTRSDIWVRLLRRSSRVDECLVWYGCRNNRGYGLINVDREDGRGNVKVSVHRLSYELTYGPIPNGLFVCHSCDNPPCIEPSHLWIGTPRDNSRDASIKGHLSAPFRPPRLGSESPNPRLDETKVADVRRRLLAGEPQRLIANLYGVKPSTISDIACRRTWTHIA